MGAMLECDRLVAEDVNPTMQAWRTLPERGAPYTEVQLLRDNPVAADISGWTDLLAEYGYPVYLILDHLCRVAGRNARASQQR